MLLFKDHIVARVSMSVISFKIEQLRCELEPIGFLHHPAEVEYASLLIFLLHGAHAVGLKIPRSHSHADSFLTFCPTQTLLVRSLHSVISCSKESSDWNWTTRMTLLRDDMSPRRPAKHVLLVYWCCYFYLLYCFCCIVVLFYIIYVYVIYIYIMVSFFVLVILMFWFIWIFVFSF